MVSTDPISDMLTRIRNAISVRKNEVLLPHSNIKEAVAKLLQENNFIDKVSIEDEGINKKLKLQINSSQSNARITEIVRMSRPGRRLYSTSDKIPIVKRGRGIVILSTSRGILTGQQAKKSGVGGEIICKVY